MHNNRRRCYCWRSSFSAQESLEADKRKEPAIFQPLQLSFQSYSHSDYAFKLQESRMIRHSHAYARTEIHTTRKENYSNFTDCFVCLIVVDNN